jgi:hypothetical protein
MYADMSHICLFVEILPKVPFLQVLGYIFLLQENATFLSYEISHKQREPINVYPQCLSLLILSQLKQGNVQGPIPHGALDFVSQRE